MVLSPSKKKKKKKKLVYLSSLKTILVLVNQILWPENTQQQISRERYHIKIPLVFICCIIIESFLNGFNPVSTFLCIFSNIFFLFCFAFGLVSKGTLLDQNILGLKKDLPLPLNSDCFCSALMWQPKVVLGQQEVR